MVLGKLVAIYQNVWFSREWSNESFKPKSNSIGPHQTKSKLRFNWPVFCCKKNSPVDSKKWPVDIDYPKIDDVLTHRVWKSILIALKLLKFPLQNFISNIFIVSNYANVEVCLWCDPWMIMMVYPPRFYKVAKFKLFILFNTVCDATKYIYRFWHYI